MNRKDGAGGSWLTPWTKLDYVKSQLTSVDYTLRHNLGWGEMNLLTSDEAELLHHIAEARRCLERIMG